jgi:hypothetical protein
MPDALAQAILAFMSLRITAQATCDHCGTTAPCTLDGSFMGHVGVRRFEKLAIATHGLRGWSAWEHLMACSAECRDALSKKPPKSDYSDSWTSLG